MSKNIIVEYRSNNSGGSWWLSDGDWKALEKAGWVVDWNRDFVWNKGGSHVFDKNGFPKFKKTKEWGDRFLGALAKTAYKKCNNITEAINEFEEITGQDSNADGCSCCGRPHDFCEL